MNVTTILKYSIGPFGAAFLGMLSLPLLTWIIPQKDIGIFSLYNLFVGFSLIICSLGLDQSYIRDYHSSSDRSKLLINCFIPGTVVLMAFFILVSCLYKFLFPVEIDFGMLLVIFVGVTSTYFYRYITLFLRLDNKPVSYSISQLIPKLFFIILVIALYYSLNTSLEFKHLIILSAASLLLSLVYFFHKTIHYWKGSKVDALSKIEFIKLAKYGLPLAFSGLVYWALTAVDRFFIAKLASLEELALYSVAMSISSAAMILKTLFQTLWAPTVYNWVHQKRDLSKVDSINSIISFLVIVGFCIMGLLSEFVNYFIPSNYHSVYVLAIACVGFPLFLTLAEATGIGINVTKRTYLNFYSAFISLLLNILMNYLLIPTYGAKGAAASTLVSFWLYFIFKTFYSRIYWRIFPVFKIYLFSTLCMTLSLLSLFYMQVENELLKLIWLMFLILSLYCYRKTIQTLYQFVLYKKVL